MPKEIINNLTNETLMYCEDDIIANTLRKSALGLYWDFKHYLELPEDLYDNQCYSIIGSGCFNKVIIVGIKERDLAVSVSLVLTRTYSSENLKFTVLTNTTKERKETLINNDRC